LAADANGNFTTMTYYLNKLLKVQRDPLNRATTFTYTQVDFVQTREDAHGLATNLYYWALNLPWYHPCADGTRVTLTYDAASQLTQMQDVSGTSSYGYDLAGRQNTLSGVQLTYSYDPDGNRLAMTEVGSGLAATTFAYDPAWNLTQITDPYGQVTTQIYDVLNRPLQQLGGATTLLTTFGYDPAGRTLVKNLQPNPWVPPSDPPIGSYVAAYDAAGNRTSVAETSRQVTYTYDPANQVLSDFLTGPWFFSPTAAVATYSYDPAGNRATTSGFAPGASNVLTTYTNGPGNELTSAVSSAGSPTTQTFDLNGNLLTRQIGSAYTTYTWDGENRLSSIAVSPSTAFPAGAIVTNIYDGNGLRQGYRDSTGLTTLTYDGQNIYRRDVGSIGSVQRYTNEPGGYGPLIGQSDTRSGVTSQIYAVSDLSGNIRNWWSPGTRGNLDPYAYEAYGQEWIVPAPEPPLSYNVPFLYEGDSGYYQDPTTGLIYVRARWYDPVTGRFISEDPIWPDGGVNPYEYAGNTPVMARDPTGLACIVEVNPSPGPKYFHSYDHAYIQFNITSCNSYNSYGFWPNSSCTGAVYGPGAVHAPDCDAPPGDPLGGNPFDVTHVCKETDDTKCFETALCDIVRSEISKHGVFCVGYRVCGSWAHDVWSRAKARCAAPPGPSAFAGSSCPGGEPYPPAV
jgi:RHS repeat-associated protein